MPPFRASHEKVAFDRKPAEPVGLDAIHRRAEAYLHPVARDTALGETNITALGFSREELRHLSLTELAGVASHSSFAERIHASGTEVTPIPPPLSKLIPRLEEAVAKEGTKEAIDLLEQSRAALARGASWTEQWDLTFAVEELLEGIEAKKPLLQRGAEAVERVMQRGIELFVKSPPARAELEMGQSSPVEFVLMPLMTGMFLLEVLRRIPILSWFLRDKQKALPPGQEELPVAILRDRGGALIQSGNGKILAKWTEKLPPVQVATLMSFMSVPLSCRELIRLCDHQDPRVRAAAVEALGSLAKHFSDPKDIIEILQRLSVDENGRVRVAAAKALGEAAETSPDPKAVVEILQGMLGDQDQMIHTAVVEGLVKAAKGMPDPQGFLGALRSTLSGIDASNVRLAAAEMSVAETVKSLSDPGEVIETLLRLANGRQSAVRIAAIKALAEAAKNSSDPQEIIETLEGLLYAADFNTRVAAVRAMGEVAKNLSDPQQVVEALQRLPSSFDDRYMLILLVEALGEATKDGNAGIIIETLLRLFSDKTVDGDVQLAVVKGLGKVGKALSDPQEVVEILRQISLDETTQWDNFPRIVKYIFKTEIHREILTKKLLISTFRVAAAEALGEIAKTVLHPQEPIAVLDKIIEDKSDPVVRVAAALALGRAAQRLSDPLLYQKSLSTLLEIWVQQSPNKAGQKEAFAALNTLAKESEKFRELLMAELQP